MAESTLKATPRGKPMTGDELLTKGELDEPDLIRRYIRKFRDAKGATAQRYTRESAEWFYKRVSKDFNVRQQRKQLFESGKYAHRAPTGIQTGKLYLFKYDAIDEGGKLPYWDMYPMVFFFGTSKSAAGKTLLHGLNMHYLPPKLRFILFLELLKLKTSKKYTPRSRLRAEYMAIQGASKTGLYLPCIKTYRADHVMSHLVEIPANVWEISTFLNIDQWQKADRAEVYKDALGFHKSKR